MSVRSMVIREYGRTHTVDETSRLIVKLFGIDTPKDDGGHWYEKEGAPCPHNNGMADLNEEERARANKMLKSLSIKHPKINQKSQDQHINAQNAAAATKADRAAHPDVFMWAKSYFNVKMQAAHAMVLDRIRKGKYRIVVDQMKNMHLLVDVEKKIGTWYNRKDQKQPSSLIRVDWSEKEGYHIYPTGDDRK